MNSHAPGEELSQRYWDGAREGVLVLQACGQCGRVRHYPRVLCDACYSFEVQPHVASGRGTVHSWMVAHHAFDPAVADEVPYVLVTVDMEEGVRVLGRWEDGELRLGLPVELSFMRDNEENPRPTFHRAAAG